MRHRVVLAAPAVLLVAAALAGASSAAVPPAPTPAWLSNGHDPQLTAAVASPQGAPVGFRSNWHTTLDGGIVAQPLAVTLADGGLRIFAATRAGSVYALDVSGAVVWRTELGTTVADSGCGTYGISSTGVVDPTRGVLFVAGADGYVHALRLSDGSEAAGWPVRIAERPRVEYVWGGLRLLDNRLYVPLASYCDAPDESGVPAEGGLLAVDVDEPQLPPLRFDPVPGENNLGGIWGWGGVSVAPDGKSIYVGIGNAEPDVDNGYSDSLVQLTPDLGRVLGASRPPGAIPGADIDLGAAPVLFQPTGCPRLLAANDKDGTVIVWRQDALDTGVYARLPASNGVSAFVGAPAWSSSRQMLYVGGSTGNTAAPEDAETGVLAFAIGPKCTFVPRWFRPTGTGPQPQPLVFGDLVLATGGMSGGLVAIRASTGSQLWQMPTEAGTWSPPIAVGGLIFVGDLAGNLYELHPRVVTRIRR